MAVTKGRNERLRRILPPLLLCAILFGAATGFETVSEPAGVAQGYLVSSAKDGKNAALAQAAGEFRIVAANLLWAKVVDHYHHQFLAEGGDWAKNESLLPLLQTIIELDPHFCEAYRVMGGTILPQTGHVAEGDAVLRKGIKNNPNDWEMYREMAILCARTEHNPQAALSYAQEGLTQANTVTDDEGFARHLMTKLCLTLTDMSRVPTGVTASRHPSRQPA